MAAPLSQDLRRRLQALERGCSAHEAARRFAVSESAAIKLVRRVRETGSTASAGIGGYRKPLLAAHEDLLRELTATKNNITRAEIQAGLVARGIEASCLTTIWSTLRRLGYRKKYAEGRRAGPARCRHPPPRLAILAALHGPGAFRVHR